MWSLRQAQVAIVIAGCLGAIYTQLTTSAASIEFARDLGGSGLHVGILGALPTGMLFMQFVAAWIANRLQYRRYTWFRLTLVQRLLCVPVACGPLILPEPGDTFWLWSLLVVFAVNQGLIHFTTPLWLSWMGDYLPRQGLSQFWGGRQLWMQIASAAALIGSGLYLWQTQGEIRTAFAWLVVCGSIAGVVDLLFFFKVDEPPVTRLPQASLREILRDPFRHEGFRSFIAFTSFWHFAAMTGAPFISLYLLEYVGMDLYQVLTLWTFSWIGGGLASRWLGRLVETYGNRPVLVLCTALKSINMLGLLLVPRSPGLALALLAPVFMVDMALNTGIAIANNGFLLQNSPAANRTMFIAAGTAVAGLVGGITSIVCGAWLAWMGDWSVDLSGRVINGFHVLFLLSLVLRLVAAVRVQSIHEPRSAPTRQVVTCLVADGPLRVLRYPVGFYRRFMPERIRKTEPVVTPIRPADEFKSEPVTASRSA